MLKRNTIEDCNKVVMYKQIGRILGGTICGLISLKCFGDYKFQKGATANQAGIAKIWPKEYAKMTNDLERLLRERNK